MGILNITPMDELTDGGKGEVAQILRVSGDAKNLTTSATSARTTFPTGYNFIRVVSDTDEYIQFGVVTDDAIVGDIFLPANVVEYFQPKEGQTHILAINK